MTEKFQKICQKFYSADNCGILCNFSIMCWKKWKFFQELLLDYLKFSLKSQNSNWQGVQRIPTHWEQFSFVDNYHFWWNKIEFRWVLCWCLLEHLFGFISKWDTEYQQISRTSNSARNSETSRNILIIRWRKFKMLHIQYISIRVDRKTVFSDFEIGWGWKNCVLLLQSKSSNTIYKNFDVLRLRGLRWAKFFE